MNLRTWCTAALAAAALTGLAARGAFSEDPKPPEGGGGDMEKMMEELAAAGDMHKWLAKFDGDWKVNGEFSEMDGSKTTSTGKASFKMVLGGRFSQQTYEGTFKGKPFHGHGMTGYDNLSKKFENFWFDTMGTTPSVARGERSADGKSLTLSGTWTMPGNQSMAFQFVTKWVSDTSFTFEMVMDVGGGNMVPVGVLTYTR